MQQTFFILCMLYILWSTRKMLDLERQIRKLRKDVSIVQWVIKKLSQANPSTNAAPLPASRTRKGRDSPSNARVDPNVYIKGGGVFLSLLSIFPKVLWSLKNKNRR